MRYPNWVTQGHTEYQRFELTPPPSSHFQPDFDQWIADFRVATEKFISELEAFHAEHSLKGIVVGHTDYGYSDCYECGSSGDSETGHSISVDLNYEVPLSEKQIESNKAQYNKAREAEKARKAKLAASRKNQLAKTVKANKKEILEILNELEG